MRSKFDAINQEFSDWDQVYQWAAPLGKGDKINLYAFVQSLVFGSLIAVANRHLFAITGRYKLVQKPGVLDFEVEDINFEQSRETTNLSGGETFIVSLSLALAISEFASKRVRIDSLFLDEGFGTLSGDILMEAINALKNLQKQGKMLGIITHVDRVIEEIEHHIDVKPTHNGHSVLIGSGITQG